MQGDGPADPYRLVRHFGFATLAVAFLCRAVAAILRMAGALDERHAFRRTGIIDELAALPSPVEGMSYTLENVGVLFFAMGILGLLLGGAASWATRPGRRAVAGAALLLTTWLALGPGLHLLPDAPRQTVWEAADILTILLVGASLAFAVSGAASRAATLAIASGTLAHLAHQLLLPTAGAAPYPDNLTSIAATQMVLALGSALLAGGLVAHVAAEREHHHAAEASAAAG